MYRHCQAGNEESVKQSLIFIRQTLPYPFLKSSCKFSYFSILSTTYFVPNHAECFSPHFQILPENFHVFGFASPTICTYCAEAAKNSQNFDVCQKRHSQNFDTAKVSKINDLASWHETCLQTYLKTSIKSDTYNESLGRSVRTDRPSGNALVSDAISTQQHGY